MFEADDYHPDLLIPYDSPFDCLTDGVTGDGDLSHSSQSLVAGNWMSVKGQRTRSRHSPPSVHSPSWPAGLMGHSPGPRCWRSPADCWTGVCGAGTRKFSPSCCRVVGLWRDWQQCCCRCLHCSGCWSSWRRCSAIDRRSRLRSSQGMAGTRSSHRTRDPVYCTWSWDDGVGSMRAHDLEPPSPS